MFSDIVKKYSAINTLFGTDKVTSHSYEKVYDELFSPFENSCNKLLEIGFSGGFSLQCYNEYFKNAEIYGIDIVDDRQDIIKNNKKLNVYFGDATHESTINAFPYTFDIIVEDASHQYEHQIQHFLDYSKYVKPGGIYVIEDVNGEYQKNIYDRLITFATDNNFTCTVYDLRHVKSRFDDILIVYKKNTA